jgi:hypothetical protein
MKLSYSPLTCRLAGHIVLLKADLHLQHILVDVETIRTNTVDGRLSDYDEHYVPAESRL